MEDISRRQALILGGALALPLGLVVEGCTPGQTNQWLSAEQAIGQEFTIVAPELASLGINPKAQVTIAGQTIAFNGSSVAIFGQTVALDAIGALVQQLTAGLSEASSVSQGQSVLITAEVYINAVVPVIWPVVGPLVVAADPGVGLTLGLIVKALPAMEGMLNLAVDFTKNFLSAQAQQLAVLAPSAPASMRMGGTTTSPAEQALQQLMQRAAGR